MQIAVDARFLQTSSIDLSRDFTSEIILRLVDAYKSHRFLFFVGTHIDSLVSLPENVSLLTINPSPTNILLYKWWYDIRIPIALRKYKADVFISAYGVCGSTKSIPQLLIVGGHTFLSPSVIFSKSSRSFNKRPIVKSFRKASIIAAFSDFIKKEIVTTYNISEGKIKILNIAAEASFKPVSWEEREKIKEKYTSGCEYFIFAAGSNPGNQLIDVLKAFSIFKKWQRTNMKLVVTINSKENKNLVEKLSSYKYKDEVILVENLGLTDVCELTAGAYAIILLSKHDGVETAVLEAMQCEVPVITSANGAMKEIAENAALYCDTGNPQEVADQMKLIFKDEQLRSTLIVSGRDRVKEFTWDRTITSMWNVIQQTVSR